MTKSRLREVFSHLSQRSVNSVQNGYAFTEWDEYMHVDRPIEGKLCAKMDEIENEGGGIILLVGSAGDGKSHLISRIKQMSDWDDDCFYNDATASSSPKKTAIDTLKEALSDFKDSSLHSTSKKLVLAINLGKLNALIDDEDFISEYKEIVNSTIPIFDDDDTTPPIDTARVKVIMFVDEQLFEFFPDRNEGLPVESRFLSSILDKIVSKNPHNPFYSAYLYDLNNGIDRRDPLLLNYELLSISEVRHTIVMSVIEAIIRFKMNITPREFFDFIYSIMVYQYEYIESKNFYEALLPTLLYNGFENMIQKATKKLDPLKQNSTEHDEQLSVLFTSYSIPASYFDDDEKMKLPIELLTRTNAFYANNGRDIERTTKFVFRLKHLLSYHSENSIYIEFLNVLRNIYKNDIPKMQAVYNLVANAIPRHYGSYYSKKNMIPLNIQGGEFRLYGKLNLIPQPIKLVFSPNKPNEFLLRFDMSWKFPDGNVPLRMDYQLYSYLYDLNKGRLALSYENEKNLEFSIFVRKLIAKCNCTQEITVVRTNFPEKSLTESSFGNIELQ